MCLCTSEHVCVLLRGFNSLHKCDCKTLHLIFKCSSVEPYSSLLEIHNSSILLQLSAFSWIKHSALSLSALSAPRPTRAARLWTAPSRAIFSSERPALTCAELSSCSVKPSPRSPAADVERFIGWTLLIRQTFWRRAVMAADTRGVVIYKLSKCWNLICRVSFARGGGGGENIVSVTLIALENQQISFYQLSGVDAASASADDTGRASCGGDRSIYWSIDLHLHRSTYQNKYRPERHDICCGRSWSPVKLQRLVQ